ncbi:MAG: hypothetical protein ACAH24_12495 [Hyphomicrobiaceae bacterium]|jgi:hypothetical protein
MPSARTDSTNIAVTGIADRFLARLRDWWQARDELGGLDRHELERLAGEFGMSARDLEDLAAHGPGAADLLYERMHALGITRDDAERLARGLMRDLERTCSCCADKGVCRKDLAAHPEDPAWKTYCPNAISLESVQATKGRFPV